MNRRDHELAAHQTWLRRVAKRIVRSGPRADDLVQETYITALHNAPPDAKLRPWLRVVMRRLAWGESRSERRRALREESFSLTAPALTMPDTLLVDHDLDRERLTAAVAGLPEPFRSTIVKRFFDGRSCAEIARSDNVPAGTVRWRQARGLEMLRAQLMSPRRQPVMWALPFLGTGQRLVVRVWHAMGGKLLWLWLAAALLYALGGSRVAPDDPAGNGDLALARGHATGTLVAAPGRSTDMLIARNASGPALLVAAARATNAVGDGLAAGAFDGVRRARDGSSLSAIDGELDIRGDDCRWDPPRGWRCADAPAISAASSDALCAVVRQQILIGDALAHGSPTARRFLAAARQANLALAQRLGCPPIRADAIGDPTGGAGGRTACTTEKRPDGTVCTSCEGERPVCAPAKCQSRLTDDGIACSSCIDAKGQTYSDCPEPPVSCHSEVADSGLLCSVCGGPSNPPECLPAECGVIDRCMRCTDPKGRIGVDCSMDYEEVRTGGSLGIMPSNDQNLDWNLAGCSFLWGFGNFGGTTCHYPGTTSCVVSGEDDWQCLSCSYPDGSGSGICTGDGLPDPLANLPSDLPAPGNCVNKLGADGQVACTTCTHADGSATRSCHHPGVADCAFSFEDLTDPACITHCTLDDGSSVCLRNSASGPEPIRTNAAR